MRWVEHIDRGLVARTVAEHACSCARTMLATYHLCRDWPVGAAQSPAALAARALALRPGWREASPGYFVCDCGPQGHALLPAGARHEHDWQDGAVMVTEDMSLGDVVRKVILCEMRWDSQLAGAVGAYPELARDALDAARAAAVGAVAEAAFEGYRG